MHSRNAASAGGPGSRLVAVASVAVMALSAAVLVAAVREHRSVGATVSAGRSAGGSAEVHASPTAPPAVSSAESTRDRQGRGADEVSTPPVADRSPADGRASWRSILTALDTLRARAYAATAARLLRRVYTPGSPALRADRRLLRRYQHRGLRVIHLRLQVADVRVRARGPAYVVLRVRDRVSDGVVLGGSTRRRLPTDEFETRTVTLRRVAGEWRVSAVRPT